MTNSKQQFILISGKTNSIDYSSDLILDLLKLEYDFIEVEGLYQGQSERSFLVLTDSHNESRVAELGLKYGQDCILKRNTRGECTLIDTKYSFGTEVYIGRWTEVSQEYALTQDNSTKHGDRYFICK